MKIAEVISRSDGVKQGVVSVEQAVAWLSELDYRVKTEIIDKFEGDVPHFKEYKASDLKKELLVPSPYGDRMYIHWIEAMVDYDNGEMEKYLNSYAMFNATYSEFQRYYIRTHMPKSVKFRNYGG